MHDLIDTLNGPAFDLFGAPTSWAELFGFVTGLAAVGLAALGRVSNFPLGIVNAIFFGILFLDADLFANAVLQVMFLALCVHGWWAWLRLGPQRTELPVTHASPVLLAAVAVGVVALAAALVPILDASGNSAPELDGITVAMSIGAQVLLNLKKVESWYVWIAVDLVYIPMYLDRDLVLTAIVYAAFLTICLVALHRWRRQPAPAPAFA